MNYLNIGTLITYLNTKTTLTDLVWNRIYYWYPTEQQSGVFIVMEREWQKIREVYSYDIVSVKIIWHETWITYADLDEISNTLNDILTIEARWEFNVIKILSTGSVANTYDTLNRPLIDKNYYIYYLN